MSNIFQQTYDSAFQNKLKEIAGDIVISEVARISDAPGFEEMVLEAARRGAKLWVQELLGSPQRTQYEDVFDFVDRYVCMMWPKNATRAWCPKWWDHPEVVRRFTLMWTTWESAVAQKPATGEEQWLRTVGDPHMKLLADKDGSFMRCDEIKHHRAQPLQVTNKDEEQ